MKSESLAIEFITNAAYLPLKIEKNSVKAIGGIYKEFHMCGWTLTDPEPAMNFPIRDILDEIFD